MFLISTMEGIKSLLRRAAGLRFARNNKDQARHSILGGLMGNLSDCERAVNVLSRGKYSQDEGIIAANLGEK